MAKSGLTLSAWRVATDADPAESKDKAEKQTPNSVRADDRTVLLAPMITTVKGTSFMPINQFEYTAQSVSFSKRFTSYVFV